MKVRPGLVAAYLLGLAPPLLEALWPGLELLRGAHAPVLWLVALFTLSYPRAAACEGRALTLALAELAWLLPPLGLLLGLDLARGLAGPRAFALTLGFAALCLAWSALGAAASHEARTRARYRDAWLLCVPGLAALTLALAWVPRAADDPPGARLFALSPLVLAQRAALPDGLAARTAFEFALAFVGVGLAAAYTRLARGVRA